MTNKKLNELIDEFVESQPMNDKDDIYITSQGMSIMVMSWFVDFCREKGINLTQIEKKED